MIAGLMVSVIPQSGSNRYEDSGLELFQTMELVEPVFIEAH
jgi:hypothetical protein